MREREVAPARRKLTNHALVMAHFIDAMLIYHVMLGISSIRKIRRFELRNYVLNNSGYLFL